MFARFLLKCIVSCLLYTGFLVGEIAIEGPSIVFVHIGKSMPPYLETAVKQARLFNSCPIKVVANEEAIQQSQVLLEPYHVTFVACEEMPKTAEHISFLQHSKLDRTFRNGFWSHATERFFYLQDLMEYYQLTDVVHLENDNMVYVDILSIVPIFKDLGIHVGLTMDNDERCIPGFVYIADAPSMSHVATSICGQLLRGVSDMYSLGSYYQKFHEPYVGALPIVMSSYVVRNELVTNDRRRVAKNKFMFCQYETAFGSIFDAAALGQYLGGIDPRNGLSKPGFINESCVFNPSLLTFSWKIDERGRKVPYASYDHTELPINNLHIHSKNLEAFLSDRI